MLVPSSCISSANPETLDVYSPGRGSVASESLSEPGVFRGELGRRHVGAAELCVSVCLPPSPPISPSFHQDEDVG